MKNEWGEKDEKEWWKDEKSLRHTVKVKMKNEWEKDLKEL